MFSSYGLQKTCKKYSINQFNETTDGIKTLLYENFKNSPRMASRVNNATMLDRQENDREWIAFLKRKREIKHRSMMLRQDENVKDIQNEVPRSNANKIILNEYLIATDKYFKPDNIYGGSCLYEELKYDNYYHDSTYDEIYDHPHEYKVKYNNVRHKSDKGQFIIEHYCKDEEPFVNENSPLEN